MDGLPNGSLISRPRAPSADKAERVVPHALYGDPEGVEECRDDRFVVREQAQQNMLCPDEGMAQAPRLGLGMAHEGEEGIGRPSVLRLWRRGPMQYRLAGRTHAEGEVAKHTARHPSLLADASASPLAD